MALFSWSVESPRQAIIFATFIITQAFLEMSALAIIFPYFNYLESGELIIAGVNIQHYFGLTLITCFACSFILLVGVLRYSILKRVVTFAYFQEMHLSKLVMSKIIRYPYADFHKISKTDIYRLVATEIPQAVNAYLVAIIYMLMSFVSIMLIGLLLLNLNALMTFFSILCLFSLYAIISVSKNKNIINLGDERLSINSKRFEIFGNVLEAFKAIRILNQTDAVEKDYNSLAFNYASVHSDIQFATLSPRVIIECAITLVIIFGSFLFVSTSLARDASLPELIFFAVAAVKLLPHFQVIYSRWAAANYTLPTVLYVNDMLEKLNKVKLKARAIASESRVKTETEKIINRIVLKGVNLSIDGKQIIHDVNFTFKRGFVNIIRGPSGSGKTTLLNIVSGLMRPSSGSISINDEQIELYENEQWFDQLSYVDQFPYLRGETVSDLLGNKPNFDQDIGDSWVSESFVGLGLGTELRLEDAIYQGGLNFSGGQRQRLAFMSAVAKSRGVLLLDEVNSGLDEENERKIFEIIDTVRESHLVILISHGSVNLASSKTRFLDMRG